MTVITCHCGQQLEITESMEPGSTCPNCGRTVSQPSGSEFGPRYANPAAGGYDGGSTVYSSPNYGSTYGSHPQQNSDAVIGLVMGLISIFTCFFIVAPVGVYFSIRGMRQHENQGMAVAALIMNVIGCMALVGLIIYFVFVALVIGGIGFAGAAATQQAVATQREINRTQTVMTSVDSEIRVFVQENEALPEQQAGTQLVAKHQDAWGNPLEYTIESAERAVITSAGPDGISGNGDDLKRTIRRSSAMRPIPAAPQGAGGQSELESVEEMLDHLESDSILDRNHALRALAEAQPDPQYRQQVVAATTDLLFEFAHQHDAKKILLAWATKEDAESLVDKFLTADGATFSIVGNSLVEILQKLEAGEALIRLTTVEDLTTYSSARRAVKDLNIESRQIVQHCMAVLDDPSQIGRALDYLEKIDQVEDLKSELNRKLNEILKDASQRRQALSVVKKWGPTEECLVGLAEAGEYRLIASVESEQSLKLLADAYASSPHHSVMISTELKRIGPAAESCLWPALDPNQETSVLMFACSALDEIGTKESLPHLKKLESNRSAWIFARRTIENIERSDRQPTKVWQGR